LSNYEARERAYMRVYEAMQRAYTRAQADAEEAGRKLEEMATRIADLETAAQSRFREEWKADVGSPFFEAAKAAADDRMAALKHEARGHLMRAEAAERTVAEMRVVLREIEQLAERASSNRMDGLTATSQFDAIAEQARVALSRASDSSPQRG
jgi:predicted  nucleic acid-binding Zn-ribbon protein